MLDRVCFAMCAVCENYILLGTNAIQRATPLGLVKEYDVKLERRRQVWSVLGGRQKCVILSNNTCHTSLLLRQSFTKGLQQVSNLLVCVGENMTVAIRRTLSGGVG